MLWPLAVCFLYLKLDVLHFIPIQIYFSLGQIIIYYILYRDVCQYTLHNARAFQTRSVSTLARDDRVANGRCPDTFGRRTIGLTFRLAVPLELCTMWTADLTGALLGRNKAQRAGNFFYRYILGDRTRISVISINDFRIVMLL